MKAMLMGEGPRGSARTESALMNAVLVEEDSEVSAERETPMMT